MIETPMPQTWLVTAENGPRPNGKPDECFYCQVPIGSTHAVRCVCRKKQVLLRFVVELPVIIPDDWNERMVLFHRNEGTYCNDNVLDWIASLVNTQQISERGYVDEHDLCDFSYFQIIRDDDPVPLDTDGDYPLISRAAIPDVSSWTNQRIEENNV